MDSNLEREREGDGRWLAEVPEPPGVWVDVSTASEAMVGARGFALRVQAEQMAQGEERAHPIRLVVPAA